MDNVERVARLRAIAGYIGNIADTLEMVSREGSQVTDDDWSDGAADAVLGGDFKAPLEYSNGDWGGYRQ